MIVRLPAIVALFIVATVTARAGEVALTFDDLPTLSLTPSFAYEEMTTVRLLDGLRRNHLPATGFVNEGKLEGEDRTARIALLERWLDAGMDLGNHGYSHLSLNKTPVDAYIDDVARGAIVTSALLKAHGRLMRWYRYPYLETGLTIETRHTFENWLKNNGYRVAPVTMENTDWVFALPYDDAVLRGDAAGAARIRLSYLTYTSRAVSWYREASFELLGRRPAFVFLLHASRLNADSIDQLASILKANDLKAVTLDRAMSDPAYNIADTYVGPDGDEWLSRWSRTLHRELPWSDFPSLPAGIEAEDHRLDPSP
ncbi:MAG TPA: polysaccharide deacetylase family protein [Rhizomicrobium sp.]|jgi:peptidoglycan/xylan/chitin deacetylase (PgdA/CDA1 family)|nr:polysaccharide deacetylase family protein [Rhizomicrobium sp.]